MPETVENITGIHEKKLIRKLVQTDQRTRLIFEDYIRQTSDIFSRYRENINRIVVRNPQLDAEFKEANDRLKSQFELMIKDNQAWAWMQANEKNDQIINSYIEKLPTNEISSSFVFEPIPLTEEWLKKFGLIDVSTFHLMKDQQNKTKCFKVPDIEPDYIIFLVEQSGIYLAYTNDFDFAVNYTEKPIKFVHTFQNLIFDLTGQELEVKE